MKSTAHFVSCLFVFGSLVLGTDQSMAAVELQTVITNLSRPLYVTSAKDGTARLFIVEQPGRIKVVPHGNVPSLFLDLTTKVLSGGERGLLGLAFHPDFAVNARFYVNYTRKPDGATVIAEYTASPDNPNVADPTGTVLLVIPQPFPNHNGGMIEFGPDRYLYIGMGDGGSGNDPNNRAQDKTALLGKILRIDVDKPNGSVPYSSAQGNPFFGCIAGRDEIFALGFRNPYRFSFDRGTGKLFVGDVGQDHREEIDIVTLGRNYGWRVWEGTLCTGNDPDLCGLPNFIPPIAEYDHNVNDRCSITGGYVYRGTRSTLPIGGYVFGDFCTGEILVLADGVQTPLLDTDYLISSFGEDESGELYVADLNGRVGRLRAVPRPDPCEFAVSPTDQNVPAAGAGNQAMVLASAGCHWLAASQHDWITITSGAQGTGNGSIFYSVQANTKTGPRSGRIRVAGQTINIDQAGGSSCTFAITPTARNSPANSTTNSLHVSTASPCHWEAVSDRKWIRIISGKTGAGNGTVTYALPPNNLGMPRTGTITVDNKTFTVTQFAITPISQTFDSSTGTGTVTVRAPNCVSWTASSNAGWIKITAGQNGNGNGTVAYSVTRNNSGRSRTGIIRIAGSSFTVKQAR